MTTAPRRGGHWSLSSYPSAVVRPTIIIAAAAGAIVVASAATASTAAGARATTIGIEPSSVASSPTATAGIAVGIERRIGVPAPSPSTRIAVGIQSGAAIVTIAVLALALGQRCWSQRQARGHQAKGERHLPHRVPSRCWVNAAAILPPVQSKIMYPTNALRTS